ncbi:MAG: 16S rRNA (guanine(966)-N(2))-methyltransferase RsmD [Melioribacteraceae bacterium]|nr:16S rRNA (guanine(966)-N(2))-methyltransferase RsmD [Melioribacteraceae bacterium]
MRIIAGKYGGRTVKMPKSKLVRPTTDKVKESLFNYLNTYIPLNDIKVCDIYAGSGSLGLEALSRGAAEVHFVEKNFNVLKNLKNNIEVLKAENQCSTFNMEAVKFSELSNHSQYDLILLDPPFFHDDVHQAVKNLLAREYLAENGVMIIERSVQTRKKDVENFGIEPLKEIGDSLIYQFDN